MKYTINLTYTAKEHLRDIAINIAEQSKEKDIAKKFIDELQVKCYTLCDMPNKGANPDDRVLASMGYIFLIHKDYLIFYTVDECNTSVYIEAIFNAKKDYTRFLRKFK